MIKEEAQEITHVNKKILVAHDEIREEVNEENRDDYPKKQPKKQVFAGTV